MKFIDYINNFDVEDNIVYLCSKYEESYKVNTLIVLNTLISGGSQYAIERILPYLKEKGEGIFILSVEDGAYRDVILEKYQIPIIIQTHLIYKPEYVTFLRNSFNKIFLNSCTGYFAPFYINTNIPVFWWIHETASTFNNNVEGTNYAPIFLSNNFVLLSPWDKVIDELMVKYNRSVQKLSIPIDDNVCGYYNQNAYATKLVLIPGSYSFYKGFHKVIEAIVSLPYEYLAKTAFVFVGPIREKSYYDKLRDLVSKLFNITLLEELSREKLYELYSRAYCIIVPSLLDCGPLTVVEGMMMQKPLIVSDKAGISYELSDGIDCLKYSADDCCELREKIIYSLDNEYEIEKIAERGRDIYLRHFSEKSFVEKLNQLEII